MKNRRLDLFLTVLSYILVAAAASAATVMVLVSNGGKMAPTKLDELESIIQTVFIGETDKTALEDGAAAGMIEALGDRWSYYIPADEYAAYMEQMNNAYVGIGVTITAREDGTGFEIVQVEPGGPARAAGLMPGDIITAVEGENAVELGMDGARNKIRGEAGTEVNITIQRDGVPMEVTLVRGMIQVQVAAGQMLDHRIGYVAIKNFDDRCSQEVIAAVESLLSQGAEGLVLDVRNNPGGYKDELVELLDYLLPEGDLFRSLSYDGKSEVDTSDANCLKMPMAVLINGNTYSAAEFFAAALEEYDWAVTVGEPTTGKSHFQKAFTLSDGSAVNISIGTYLTPKGVSLAEVGGLVPAVLVEVDEEMEAMIYGDLVEPREDPQVRAAIDWLLREKID